MEGRTKLFCFLLRSPLLNKVVKTTVLPNSFESLQLLFHM